MTPAAPLRVEVSVPRAVYERWTGYEVLEAVLRAHGVFPVNAREVRWRMDVERLGYIVSYSVPIAFRATAGATMKLDQQVWEALEDRGLSSAHLELLLQLLQLQRNGSVSWHFSHGQLTQVDTRVVVPSRRYEVSQVADVFLEGNSLLR